MMLTKVEGKYGINSIVYGELQGANRVYIYLHGAGEFGEDYNLQYQYPGFATLLRDGKLGLNYPFIIACCTVGTSWGTERLSQYISEVRQNNNNLEIDIIGYSRGGAGVYKYISEYRDLRTATVINSRPLKTMPATINTPLHVIHSVNDQVTPIAQIEDYLVNISGPNVQFTRWDGDHFSIEAIAKSNVWVEWIDQVTWSEHVGRAQVPPYSPSRVVTEVDVRL